MQVSTTFDTSCNFLYNIKNYQIPSIFRQDFVWYFILKLYKA